MLTGDVDRYYRRLRRRQPQPRAATLTDLAHVRDMAGYYAGLPAAEQRLLLAWARKEEAGIGVIPLALSGVPLLTLIFAPLIQQVVGSLAAWAWVALWALGVLGLVTGFWVHQHQRAMTTLHIQLLEQALRKE